MALKEENTREDLGVDGKQASKRAVLVRKE
jgi:hypothetical protein